MISAISGCNTNFRGEINAQDLINSPGQFATIPNAPADSFEKIGENPEDKKTNTGLKALIGTAVVALAAFVGLGYAVKNGHLGKVDIKEADGFFKNLWPRTKNAAHAVGSFAEDCYIKVAGWCGKEVTKAS